MKTIIAFCLCVVAQSAFCQTDTLHIRFFDTGELSALITMTDRQSGTAAAYRRDGKVIYEKLVSRMHGSTAVHFKHYEDGAVKTAVMTSHPDGGIQWSRTTTEFSETGEIVNETHETHDPLRRKPTLPDHLPERTPPELYPPVVVPDHRERPPQREKRTAPPVEKTVMECASIYQNTVEFVNHTRFRLKVRVIYKNEESFIHLKPGETKSDVTYISAEVTSTPDLNMNVDYTVSRKRRNDKIRHVVKHRTISPLESMYSFHIFESEVGE